MQTIWKFDVPILDEQLISMPEGAEILSIQESAAGQPGDPLRMWASVQTEADPKPRKIKIFGTGHPTDRLLPLDRHIGTVSTYGGVLVWHVYESA